ncbi:TrkH family potassium uptake protein [Nitratireductor sp. XY-223]|uniref:TrkH family potassium uptake protein n=1 Tax=Nitratireductor sp. XY-223 TaxID=2561926 RepID=UPI0010AB4796|nr:TrkH family potassium uptake protein [Nitratireductor sp. XY-223]
MAGAIFLITMAVSGLLALLVPAILVAVAHSEVALATDMLLLFAVGSFVAVAVITALSGRVKKTERAFTYLALVGVWAVTPLIAGLFYVVLAELPFLPAWFEAVGALTTSGATVLVRENAPAGLLFWRSSTEWYGGFLALASIVHVLAPAGFGGLQTSDSRMLSANPDHGLFRLETYGTLALQYGIITGLVFFGLMVFGVNPLNAMMLSMISAATGGFLPFTGPLEENIGRGAATVMALGLCLGTMSVFWRRNILRRPKRIFQNNLEATIVVAVILALTIAYAARILDVSGGSMREGLLAALQEGFFTASSLVATSGIETRPGVIALLPSVVVLAIIFVGAGVYSTSGGVKVFRIGAMWVYTIAELNRLIYPNSVDRHRFGDLLIDPKSMQAIWTYFIIAVLVVGTGAMLLALTATGFEAAIVMSVSFFSNASPVYDALRPLASEATLQDWPTFQELPQKITYVISILLMTIGRLEVLVIFAVLNIRYWYNR